MSIREGIAGKIIVDCGLGTEYPCPHAPEGNPLRTYELCPHEDKDVCLWQLEQADQIISFLKEETEGMENPYPDMPGTNIAYKMYEDFRRDILAKLEEK